MPLRVLPKTTPPSSRKNYNDAETYGARLALGIDLDDNWTIRPTLMGQVQKTEGNYSRERSGQINGPLQVVQYSSRKQQRQMAAGGDDH